MKRIHFKRLLAVALSTIMTLNCLPLSSLAAETSAVTVMGAEETIKVSSNTASARETNFNSGWKFYLGTSSMAQNINFDDSAWDTVTLPHDFSIIQSFTTNGEAESGFLPGGTGWYRKSFTLPATDDGRSILLNFDGVYMDSYVYVNGTYVGEHHYGYTSFAFDITDYVTCDGTTENVIAVKAVNNVPTSRWYSGSGIYRDVTLIVADPVHVDLNGVYVTTPDISDSIGTVQVEVDVVNDGAASADVTVTNTIYKNGSEKALASADTTVTVAAGSTVTAAASPVASSFELWSIDDPELYVVKTELTVDGELVDSYESTFGFRWFDFDSSGFHLNGENVKLNGVCMHHDQGALGSAAYYDAMYRQLSIMKDMGCNAIRTAHNPADQDFIEICNKLGLLVIEEAFDGLVDYKNGNTNDFSTYFETAIGSENNLYDASSDMTYSEYAARSMVKRDRNAPAIIAWSFGNEIQEGTDWTNVSRYDEICADFIEWVNEEDGSRPITSGDNNRGSDSALVDVINTITDAGGVAGFNYANTASVLYNLAQSYGGNSGCIIASETSSHTNSRGQYISQSSNTGIDGKYHLTSYDTSAVGWGITAHDSIYNTYQYDCVAGEFVWTGFDYIGEPTPYNGTNSGTVSGAGAYPNSSYFGIVETTGFEKDTYYLYRSQWNKDETTLHLVTAWDSDNMMTSSGKTPVWVYSNAPVVKLYRGETLIGTATRVDNTSSAGHTYYTYTTSSDDTSICATSSGSGADGLYAVFDVAYTSDTLSAKAFEMDGVTEIALSGNSGKNSVATPGTVSKLVVSQNESEIAADGSSLAYISVDVTDANGNLDTTATNNIVFTLTGAGEIVGVDNGDQATTAKYQQSSVLTSTTSANINAYAGKALVIVRSTEDADSFTVNVTSSGLTGGSATVTTVGDGNDVSEGLVSYTMVKDYSVKAGTVPTLNTTAIGTLADGTTTTGTIVWDDISSDVYSTAGDYTISGTLVFDDYDAINVIARLHVIHNVIAMRNVSTATTVGVVPALQSTVSGVLADGTLAGEFVVEWETVSADVLTTVDDVVTVNGIATVLGDETMPVTCTIRVAEEVQTESANVAPMASSLTQDIAAAYQSDNLDSIINGITNPGESTSERWTNWNNRYNSDSATLTMTWATAQLLSSVNLYYRYDNSCKYPESIEFSYSLDGSTYTVIDATAEQMSDVTVSNGAAYTYTFDSVINPVALKIVFTQQGGTSSGYCVGLYELETMTYAGSLEYNTSADLSDITVDDTSVENFAADTLAYEAVGSVVAASTSVNAGITVLPVYEGVIRVLTISEDGSAAKTYEVTVTTAAICEHTNTVLQNAKDATCTEVGYTGDTYCSDCKTVITTGTVSSALGHSWGEWQVSKDATCTEDGEQTCTCSVCGSSETESVAATGHQNTQTVNTKAATCAEEGYTGDVYCTDCETVVESGTTIEKTAHTTVLQNAKAATCIEEGYTGDQFCTVCNEVVSSGSAIAVTDHSWDNGVVTKEATEEEEGVMTYTCTVCSATKTETIEKVVAALKVPSVTLSVAQGSSKRITLTGKFEDYENNDDYYTVTGHGFVYLTSARLGAKSLTVNTSGRTKVNHKSYAADGSYTYNMKPISTSTKYVIRAYLVYTNEAGKSVYVYSDPITTNYNSLG